MRSEVKSVMAKEIDGSLQDCAGRGRKMVVDRVEEVWPAALCDWAAHAYLHEEMDSATAMLDPLDGVMVGFERLLAS